MLHEKYLCSSKQLLSVSFLKNKPLKKQAINRHNPFPGFVANQFLPLSCPAFPIQTPVLNGFC